MEEIWYPAENEYESGITKEQWKAFVTDRKIFTTDSLTAFACIQKAAIATCTDMAEEFCRTKNFYNNAIWRTDEKVHKLTNCPLSLRPDETERFWLICCFGRKLPNGRIELKIRPELKEAFDETGVLKGIEVMEKLKTRKIYSFEDLLAFYRKSFIDHWEEEKYKWEAVKFFQDNWNIEAENFQTMFEKATSKHKNLLTAKSFFPRKMILDFANEQPERVRKMFRNLFDEKLDLSERIMHFKSESVAIQEEHNKNNPHNIWKSNFQTENSISTYLWSKYPDKYYIYKFSEVKSVAEKLGNYEKFKEGKGIENFLTENKFYDEIAEKLNRDSEIKAELKNSLTDSCWKDSELRTLTIDFGFQVSRYFDDYEKNKMINKHTALIDKLTDLLLHTHNLIFHGAPGTGKTFLAKQIAEKMGCTQNEIGFVQFHPSYDYTDFVEGLRPKNQSSGEIGFERKDGVFKEFCKRALQNLIDSKKSVEVLEKESSINDRIENFLEKAIEEKSEFETATGNKFTIIENAEKNIFVSIPANEKTNELSLPKNDLVQLLNSENKIENGADIKSFFNRKWRTQQDSYIWILYKEILSLKQNANIQKVEKVQKKNFLFIIDEINRGELSKIFGELFYAVEPGYRVSYDDLKKQQSGEKTISTIRTQYANLETEKNEFDNALSVSNQADYGHFFIPENVYIIGTMNDIDRSVDTMDFAFRRRFAFKEIKASENLEMLSTLGEIADEAKLRLAKLNNAITEITELSSPSSYHIGGAYFLKLKDFEGNSSERFQKLWDYHLAGLLKEYLRGTENAEENFEKLRSAYFGTDLTENNLEEEGE